jgi:CDP-paratose 2-epimerase
VSRVLVTGGAGFIGSNLADRLAREGHDVLVYDALARAGVEQNLEWLKRSHPDRIESVTADVRDEDALSRAAHDADAVFHMAAQVAVTTSLVDPLDDFETNIRGTVNVLEAVRGAGRQAPVIFASTNKVYGGLYDVTMDEGSDAYQPADDAIRARGISEERPLDFHTPYGCSKGAADQYVLDYCRSFGIPTCVMRMSCIYGQRQMGTEDQGWVAHFLIQALQGRPITIYGDGKQVRDIMDVYDAVDAYMAAWKQIERVKGRAFNLGGGPANAVSLRQLVRHIERLTGEEVEIDYGDWRAGDQRYYVSDTRRVREELDLKPARDWKGGVANLAHWLQQERPGLRRESRAEPMTAGAAL